MKRLLWLLSLVAAPCLADPAFAPWIDGTTAQEAPMQVQKLDEDSFVIRQSVKTNFEAPFLYLLFGQERALLIDSGAGGLRVRDTIDPLIESWLKAHGRKQIPLIVAHSHGHGDHRKGDPEFQDRPDTIVVGVAPEEVAKFFGIGDWPKTPVSCDLGGRKLWIIPTPGHQPAHIMVFDEKTKALFSGDSLYPGRLYFPINHFAEYRDSVARAVAFTKDRQVSHLFGAHIEMTREPGKDFEDEAPAHPNERVLELPYRDLIELSAALNAMGDTGRREVHDDFIITPIKASNP
jgi:glyoxylase-like metal-dependent hydrolase (beta-lactamase superfamily II)